MTGVLDAILRAKRAEIAALGPRPPSSTDPRFAPRGARAMTLARDEGEPLRLVTEIKRKSPSAGPLSTALSVAERAVAYARGGASMISVLADEGFFDGAWSHVAEARRAVAGLGGAREPLILAKEFILDRRQLDEAAAAGADMALLIVRIVDRATLADLVAHARALGLEPLVEVVSEDEVASALAADARVIGVNARDLDTLVMDAPRAARVLAAVPGDRIAIHLSGLKTAADVATVACTDADGALVGEALMRLDDPAALFGEMAEAANRRGIMHLDRK